MNSERFDVVIIGGGMVGASLACALAHDRAAAAFDVALVESFPVATAGTLAYQPSFDARSTALSLSSAEFYDALGLWDAAREHAAAILRIHVSDRGRFGSTRMDAGEEGLEALGHVIENHWLGNVLYRRLRALPRLAVFAPAKVEELRPIDGGARVVLRAGDALRTLETAVAVIADGARSALAAALGITTDAEAYTQVALSANIAHREPHRGRAFERFTEDGPLAFLPLPDGPAGESRSALVWVLAPALADATGALPEPEFLRRLQQRFGYRLGRLLRAGARHAYPLALLRAGEQVRSGIVVLGNAAHALHPVAGQGFNLSLRDVATLDAVLREARAGGEPPGALAVLARFVEAQRADQHRTIAFSDALPRIFGIGALPLALARDLGLIGLDLLPGARSLLVRQASGLAPR